ncbi:IclR family transcriptional regulator C-terminal domain-containing protein [Nocardioides sp.]|uniref:IclR family transcriptional regulator C-terminal domain-containing protein n=1 Tax=Nocardioides sp. TaxID=35761 RepID=UPI002B273FA7|nr:IclR family transcriptional regulator C-terminal domain-containing protein [Nocardioides sp.]
MTARRATHEDRGDDEAPEAEDDHGGVHEDRARGRVGQPVEEPAAGLGKAVLATRDTAGVERLLPRDLVALTPGTNTDHDALLRELAQVRRDGYAVDRSENSADVQCYAVAIVPRHSAVVTDAVSVSVPLFRHTDELAAQTIARLLEVNDRLRKVS